MLKGQELLNAVSLYTQQGMSRVDMCRACGYEVDGKAKFTAFYESIMEAKGIITAAVAEQGTLLGTHAAFPNGVNVGFMQVVGSGHIKLRVFERGAGETLACGTGACAAVALGRRHGLLAEKVTVELPGGRLDITWSGENGDSLFMTGPVTTVFNGKMTL